jgi:DNA binding protein with HTH domain
MTLHALETAGRTRVQAAGTLPAVGDRHPLLVALEPVARQLGAELVEAADVTNGDVPLRWEDRLVGGLRLPGVHGALERMIAGVESELGAPLAELSREGKQRAVRLLEARGAFQLRKAVEEVADALGVSRFTVYNYLNAGSG